MRYIMVCCARTRGKFSWSWLRGGTLKRYFECGLILQQHKLLLLDSRNCMSRCKAKFRREQGVTTRCDGQPLPAAR